MACLDHGREGLNACERLGDAGCTRGLPALAPRPRRAQDETGELEEANEDSDGCHGRDRPSVLRRRY